MKMKQKPKMAKMEKRVKKMEKAEKVEAKCYGKMAKEHKGVGAKKAKRMH